MKKRGLSLLLALCLLAGLCLSEPAAATDALSTDSAVVSEEAPQLIPPQTYGQSGTDQEVDDSHWVYPSIYDDEEGLALQALEPVYGLDKKYQTPVRNQGSNGLCWAFGTLGSIEANLLRTTGRMEDFSELHMAYALSNHSGNTRQGYDRPPHEGATSSTAASYLMRGTNLSGLVDEAEDPYNALLLQDRDLSITQSKNKSYTVQNMLFLTSGKKQPGNDVLVKNAVKTYGGVEATMYLEGSGTADGAADPDEYYNDETGAFYYDGTAPEDKEMAYHSVVIAGWDDTYSKENFNAAHRPKRDGAWLVKNSWGESWGNNGYGWISYEDTDFPTWTTCVDGVVPYDPDTRVYETDYRFAQYTTGYADQVSAYYARAYTTLRDRETLSSVRLFVPTADTTVEVDAAVVSGNIPVVNTLNYRSFTVRGQKTVNCPGWYTINVTKPVTAKKGDKLVVIAKISSRKNGSFIGYDESARVGDDQAFYSITGSAWGDFRYNLNLKAVTVPAEETNTLSGGNVELSAYRFVYNGQDQTPQVTVTKSGKRLRAGTDYTVTFGDNRRSAGRVPVTVTGTGKYSGAVTVYYSITPAELKIKDLNLKSPLTLIHSDDDYKSYAYTTRRPTLTGVCGDDDVYVWKSTLQPPSIYSGTYDKITVIAARLSGKTAGNYWINTPVELSVEPYTVRGKPSTSPTPKPTATPTPKPTSSPTPRPTASPTPKPSPKPSSSPQPWKNPFKDINDTQWFAKSVEFVCTVGLMNGYTDGTFRPEETVTRAQTAQILYNKEGNPAAPGGTFTDVPKGKWYANAINWAAANGVVAGIGNNRFAPNDTVTHEQVITILWRYIGSPAPQVSYWIYLYDDADKISTYAKPAMCWAAENKVWRGRDGRNLDPKGNAKRSEIAYILKNYYEGKL